MWHNMANECSAIKQQLQAQCYSKINIFLPPTIINLLGDSDKASGKCRALDLELDKTPPWQCQCLSPSSPIFVSNCPMPCQTLFDSISGTSTPLGSHSQAVSQITDSSGDEADRLMTTWKMKKLLYLRVKNDLLACILSIWLEASGKWAVNHLRTSSYFFLSTFFTHSSRISLRTHTMTKSVSGSERLSSNVILLSMLVNPRGVFGQHFLISRAKSSLVAS